MAKRSVTTQVEEKQPRRTSGYLKTRRPSETVKAALDTVLLSYEEFESLTQARLSNLDNLSNEFDGLLETMQRPKAKKTMKAAFDATPAELGRKAVRAAAKNALTRKARKSHSA